MRLRYSPSRLIIVCRSNYFHYVQICRSCLITFEWKKYIKFTKTHIQFQVFLAPTKTRTHPHTNAHNRTQTHTNAHKRTHVCATAHSCVRSVCVLCAFCVCLCALCVCYVCGCNAHNRTQSHTKRTQTHTNAHRTHTERTQPHT